jgi:hypothetical protein
MRRRLGIAARASGDSRGAVMVLMAGALPVAVLFCVFVIDVANWFEHKRHLQTQADAAALAAAGSFMSCPDNQPILDKADEYGGTDWNSQVGGTQGSVHMLVNSKTYYGQPGKTDSTVKEGQPCSTKMIDVKLTETDLPWWFDLGDVDFINAHARVEFKDVDSLSGGVPFGVPDVNPVAARVWFVDEDVPEGTAGRILGSEELTRKSYANGLALWDNWEAPIPLTVNKPHIGVRVALSGSTSTQCEDPLVECYDLGSANGLLYVRGWSRDTATATAPKARDLRLFNGDCSDPYFSSTSTPCNTIGVEAQLDFGGADPCGYNVTASIGNQKRSLQCDATTGLFRSGSNALLDVTPAGGPQPVTLDWKKGSSSGSFGTVQRTFSANGRSGPIQEAKIFEGSSFWAANSLEQCSATNTSCTHQLVVRLGIQGNFEDLYKDLSKVTTPVTLRFAGGTSGSQNQALDCDPWAEDPAIGTGQRQFVDEIAYGCRPVYAKNTGATCPAQPNDLWGNSTSKADQGPAWQCVAVETGDRVSQIATGMNLRVLGDKNPSTCPVERQNKWPNIQPGDPRIMHMFLTQFGAFGGSGQNTVPVTGFATFYVTGWRGQGQNSNPCQGASPNPDDPVAEAGTVVGHFIKYVGPLDDSSGTEPCDFDSPNPCVSALTQ